MTTSSRRASAGFTLIEALVALVVTAFGMLAVASMQFNMSQGSDIAKQRSEAVRLAQEKIEQLRSFESAASHAGFDYANDVVAGCDQMAPASAPCTLLTLAASSNTRYQRAWTVTRADGVTTADGTDLEKWLRVAVTWFDRANQQQQVVLRSVISRADPGNLSLLLNGPGTTKTRTPKNRNINIPYPAVTLPGDMSAFQPPGATNTNYVFDNVTGDVLGFCTDAAIANARTTNTAVSFTGSVTSGCTAQKAYLLSGYFTFLTNVPTGGTEQGRDNGITSTNEVPKDMDVQVVFGSSMPPGHPAAQCFAQRQKVVSAGNITIRNVSSVSRTGNVVTVTTSGNHGFSAGQPVAVNNVTDESFNGQFTIASTPSGSTFTYNQTGANASSSGGTPTPTATLVQEAVIAETDTAPTGYNSVRSRFVAYTCIVQGFDDDGDEGSATTPTPRRWWGQLAITPMLTPGDSTVWTLAASGAGNRQVCRFTGDYISDDQITNTEHPLHYRGVRGPLDNQNYLVIPSTENCPSDSETNPLNDDFINTNTEVHQTAAAASGVAPFGGALSTASQWTTGGREDANTATVIPMVCPASGGPDCI